MEGSRAVETFEAHRPLLFAIAYRMLGSAMEAEDIVQEAYLRYQAMEATQIQSPIAFLRTVVTRLCLNQLESARAQREAYVGLWLPEPTRTDHEEALATYVPSPAKQAELHESLSLAFLTLLEDLTPTERAVFLLREVFDYSYPEIAEILEKDEPACRQLFSRARKHVTAHRPRFQATAEEHRRILGQFIQAVTSGDIGGLIHLLASDVTMWADGGGKVRGAPTRPLHGQEAVARFVASAPRFLPADYTVEIAIINGQPAALIRIDGQILLLIALTIGSRTMPEGDLGSQQVREIRIIGNPDKLRDL